MPLTLRACRFVIRLFSLIWMLSATVQSHPPRRAFFRGDTSFSNPLWNVLHGTTDEAGVYPRENLLDKAADEFFIDKGENEAETVFLLSKALHKQPSVLTQNHKFAEYFPSISDYLPLRRLPYDLTDEILDVGNYDGGIIGGRKAGETSHLFQKFWKDKKKLDNRRRIEESSEKEDSGLGVIPVEDEDERDTNGDFKKRENRGGKLNLGLRLMCQVDSRNCPQ